MVPGSARSTDTCGVANFWMRLLPVSTTYTSPAAFTVIPNGVKNSPF